MIFIQSVFSCSNLNFGLHICSGVFVDIMSTDELFILFLGHLQKSSSDRLVSEELLNKDFMGTYHRY